MFIRINVQYNIIQITALRPMTCLGYIWSDQNSYFWIIDSVLVIFIYLNDWSLIEQQIEIWTKINKDIF